MRKKKIDCARLILDVNKLKGENDRHKEEDYSEPAKYPHLCKECDTQMREIFNPEEKGPIFCSECGEELIVKFIGVS